MLRDDIQSLAVSLDALYQEKLSLVHLLARHARDYTSLAMSHNIPAIENIVSEDHYLAAKTDLVDFKIQVKLSQIAQASGIEDREVASFIDSHDPSIGRHIKKSKDEITQLLTNSLQGYECGTRIVENESYVLQTHIHELSAIEKVYRYLPS